MKAKAKALPGSHGTIVGRTLKETVNILVEGPSGILNQSPPDFRPRWWPGKFKLVWPNGTTALVGTGEEPDSYRGQNNHWFWGDEWAHWADPGNAKEQIGLGLRLGDQPQCLFTSTPIPVQAIVDLEAQQNCVVTRGSTYDNLLNLPQSFFDDIARLEGSDLGRQELEAEILDILSGVLFTKGLLDQTRRITLPFEEWQHKKAVVAIDPTVKKTKRSTEAAVVAGVLGPDGRAYLVEEWVKKCSPTDWARKALEMSCRWNAAIAAETNQGGELILMALKAAASEMGWFPEIIDITSIGGKGRRAKPVSVAWLGDRCGVVGKLPRVEGEFTTFVPDLNKDEDSPNALDAACICVCVLLGLMRDRFGRTILTMKPGGM